MTKTFVLGSIFLAAAGAGAQLAQVAAAPAGQPLMMAAVTPAAFTPAATPVDAGFSSSADAAPAATPTTGAAALPDAPSALVTAAPVDIDVEPQQSHASVSPLNNTSGRPGMAPRYAKYIGSDQRAYGPLTAHDKIIIGAEDLYSAGNIGAIVASSLYEQWTDGAPNYGHPNSYAKRLGAAAIRETSEGVFTDMVLSPLLHTDPRYYQRGPQHNVVDRTFYAISRVFVTRTDSGRETVNAALIGGYAGSTALQAAYYPPINRNFKDSASEFAGSIGGAALGNFLTEFAPDILHAMHLDKLHY